MTPMDPAFLLLRILQATQSVCSANQLVSTYSFLFPKVDGSTSQFRTADDLIDGAAKHLSSSSDSDNIPALQWQDVIEFFSLSCTKEALTRLCEIKGL